MTSLSLEREITKVMRKPPAKKSLFKPLRIFNIDEFKRNSREGPAETLAEIDLIAGWGDRPHIGPLAGIQDIVAFASLNVG